MRRTISLLLIVLLLMGLIPFSAYAAVDKKPAYMAYYDLLRQIKERTGEEIPLEEFSEYGTSGRIEKVISTGVDSAFLLDLNNDGLEELIIRENADISMITGGYSRVIQTGIWFQAYSYINGSVKLIAYTGPETHGEGTSICAIHFPDDIYFCKGKNGKVYISNGEPVLGSGIIELYAFNGNSMERIVSLGVGIKYDWYAGSLHSNYGTTTYMKDGDYISYSTYKSLFSNYTQNGSTLLLGGGTSSVENTLLALVGDRFTPSSWAKPFVDSAVEKKYVPNHLRKYFTSPISRGAFCALSVQFYEKLTETTITPTVSFTDTNDESIRKAATIGLVSGVGDGRFNPNGLLTREQAAVILAHLASILNRPLSENSPSFADNANIAAWAAGAVGMVQSAGLMSGKGNNNFAPKDSYTIEQSITTLVNVEDKLVGVEKIEFAEGTKHMLPGGVCCPEVTVYTNAYKRSDGGLLTFASSNTNIVSVAADGTITAKSPGTATITAAASNGFSETYKVLVHQEDSDNIILDYTLPFKVYAYEIASINQKNKTTPLGEKREILFTSVYDSWTYEGYLGLTGTMGEYKDEYGYAIRYKMYDRNGNLVAEDRYQGSCLPGKNTPVKFKTPIFGKDFPYILVFYDEDIVE